MQNSNKNSFNFLTHFVENRGQFPYYSKIVNSFSGEKVHENSLSNLSSVNKVYDISDVPAYLKISTDHSEGKLKWNKINTYKGTLIVLNNYRDVNDYLTKKFSANRRSKFRTYKKRLEKSFNITYKVYCGEITFSTYESLFDEFKKLMINRFEQKQTINKDLEQWSVYQKIGFDLILKKEACLFVIYDGEKPISICFNIIYDKIIFAYLRAYDIDYSKFYLGFTDLIIQLQWCFENDFEVFDMLKGDYQYKKQWTDDEYYFERHILYLSGFSITAFSGWSKTLGLKLFYSIFHFVKRYNAHLIYRKIKQLYLATFKINNSNSSIKPEIIENINVTPFKSTLETIDFNKNDLSFLRKHVFDFLYTHSESIDNVQVAKTNDSSNSYFIIGTKECRKITIK